MSIHTFGQKIKGFIGERHKTLIFIGIISFTGIASFYIGYIARAETTKATPVVINCPIDAYIK